MAKTTGKMCDLPEPVQPDEQCTALIAKLNECLIELDSLGLGRIAIRVEEAIIGLGGTPASAFETDFWELMQNEAGAAAH